MGRIMPRQETAQKRAQRESNIQKALKAVKTMNKDGKPEMTLRAASTAFSIPYATLHGLLKGARPHFVAHQEQQILTPLDEKAVVRWIRDLENCRFQPKVEHVCQAVELIIKGTVGANWITRVLDSHP